jgi:hypothetical protein
MEPNYQPGQYDFITNPVKPPKKGLFSFGKGNRSGTLVIIAGGLVLLTLILLIGSLFFGGDSNKDVLLAVARKQSQVIATAERGAKDGGTAQTQALGLAIELSMTTQQQELVAQLSKKDKVKEKEYASEVSADVTKQLETAERNGRFDEAFTAVIQQELEEYQTELKTANNSVQTKSTKIVLAESFEDAGLLLKIPDN